MRKSTFHISLCVIAALAAGTLVVSMVFWGQVPSPMPIHWNAAGQPDGFASRAVGLLMMPIIIALLAPLAAWSTRRMETERGRNGLGFTMAIAAAFLAGMHGLIVKAALSDGGMALAHVVGMLGVTFMTLGPVLPRLPRNKFSGIRTPWTMRDDVVWKLTHRLAGWTIAVSGGACIFAAIALKGTAVLWFSLIAILIGVLIPAVYSWGLHRTRQGRA